MKGHPQQFTPKTINEWLTIHGGRNTSDLKKDDKGYYCNFGNGTGLKGKKGLMRVYLPRELF
jgi:hypothetical protein